MSIDSSVAEEFFDDEPIGDWENNPFDPMAPAYDPWLCVKTEICEIYEKKIWRNPNKEFRERLRRIYYHFWNIPCS